MYRHTKCLMGLIKYFISMQRTRSNEENTSFHKNELKKNNSIYSLHNKLWLKVFVTWMLNSNVQAALIAIILTIECVIWFIMRDMKVATLQTKYLIYVLYSAVIATLIARINHQKIILLRRPWCPRRKYINELVWFLRVIMVS